jgi:hypothetical protein
MLYLFTFVDVYHTADGSGVFSISTGLTAPPEVRYLEYAQAYAQAIPGH